MRRDCLRLTTICLLVGFSRSRVFDDEVNPSNVTVTVSSTAIHVSWNAPNVSEGLESYRVRIYQKGHEEQKRVDWVPFGQPTRHTISCLEPNMVYQVQIFARYDKYSNNTDGHSDVVQVITKYDPEPQFLRTVWEQRLHVLIGACLMAAVVIIFTPCIVCCCCRRKRDMCLAKGDENTELKGSKRKLCSLPSAATLQRRERQARDDEDRYSTDPVHGMGYRPLGSTTISTSPPLESLPPAYSPGTQRVVSHPCEMAPPRPPMPEPDDIEDVFEDPEKDYQNTLFVPAACSQLYSNELFKSRCCPEEAPIYGNCQF